MGTCYGCEKLVARPEPDGTVTEICMKGVFGSERRTIENHPSYIDKPTVDRPAWCKGIEKACTGGTVQA